MTVVTHPMSDAVVLGIVAQLNANLPGQIAAINADANTIADGYLLQAPLLTLDYVPSPGELGQLPVLGVQYLGSTVKDDTGWGFTGTYRHVVIAYEMDQDTKGLARRLRRWERAICSCFGPDRHLDNGAAFGVKLGGTHPGPTLEHPEEPQTWLSWLGVEIVSSTDES